MPAHELTAISGQVGDANGFRWKRCVDVEVVQQGAHKLVIGLFASSQEHCGTAGPSEIRAWELNASGPPIFWGQKVLIDPTIPSPCPIPETCNVIGSAIAADPEDSNVLYVALGISWLWRLDISSVAGTDKHFGAFERIDLPGVVPCFSASSPCAAGERMTDLAVVRQTTTTGTRAMVYASLDYGRLVEAVLPSSTSLTATEVLAINPGPGKGYAQEVTATIDAATGDVVVALGSTAGPIIGYESGAPFVPDGIWTNACAGSGLKDPNPVVREPQSALRVYRRNITPPLTEIPLVQPAPPAAGLPSSKLRAGLVILCPSANQMLLYDGTTDEGFVSRTLHRGAPNETWTASVISTYQGPASGCSDGTVSVLDDTLLYLGGESFGGVNEAYMFRAEVVPGMGHRDIVPVLETVSVCPTRFEPLPQGKCPDEPTFGAEGLLDPNPFLGGVLGSANWVDPVLMEPPVPMEDSEWFVAASPTFRYQVMVGTACSYPGAGPCDPYDMCPTTALSPWRKSWLPSLTLQFPSLSDLAKQTKVGWKFVRLTPSGPTGSAMLMGWWQVASQAAGTANTRAVSVDLLFSANDPRYDVLGSNHAHVPKIIHGIRGGSQPGYKPMSTLVYMEKARNVCASGGMLNGNGQELTSDPLTTGGPPAYYELPTHVELEPLLTTPPPAQDACTLYVANSLCDVPFPTNYRYAINQKCDTFPVPWRDAEGVDHVRHVTAIACGFVTTSPSIIDPAFTQSPECPWTREFGRLMVTLYDVEDTPGGPTGLGSRPTLLRIGIGGPPMPAYPMLPTGGLYPGHAFALRAKCYPPLAGSTVPRTYLFVADLLGRLVVFDLSGDILFANPTTSTVPYRYLTPAGLFGTPVLQSLSAPGTSDGWSIEFPTSPVDGRRPNCVDIEIDGDYAYCALARAGVAVVNIADPLNPYIAMIVDTPGLAQGIFFRGKEGTQDRQMIVGDSRAGLRLYTR